MSIRAKLLLSFAVAGAFLVAIGVGAFVRIGRLDEVLNDIGSYNFQLEQVAVAQAAIHQDPSQTAQHLARLADIEKFAQTDRARELTQQARSEMSRDRTLVATHNKLADLNTYYRQASVAAHNQLVALHNRAEIETLAAMGCSVILVVVLMCMVSVWLLRPLQVIESSVNAVETGSLTQPVDLGQEAELVELGGALNRIATAIKDVNERVGKAERLAAIGESTTHIANMLRTPLNSIRTLAEYEGSAPGSTPDARVAFKHLAAIALRLERWTRDIIYVVRPVEANLSPHALEPIIGDALSLLKSKLADGEVQVEHQMSEDLPPVLVDRVLIDQVLVAVLANAIDALPDRGRIVISAITGADDTVALTIEDKGEGMAENVRSKAFNPFFTTKPDGAGLGLTIAQKIIHLHGGTIEMESEQHKGTRVTIKLRTAPANEKK